MTVFESVPGEYAIPDERREIVQFPIGHRDAVAAALQCQAADSVSPPCRPGWNRLPTGEPVTGVGPNRLADVVLRQQHQAVARIVRTLVFPAHAVTAQSGCGRIFQESCP